MKLFKGLFLVLFCLIFSWGSAQTFQDTEAVNDTATADFKYREDQFYFNITYNLLNDLPDDVKLRGFSGGARFGFLRDMPINEKRTLAIAVGGGLGFNRYGNTLSISEDGGQNTVFTVLSEEANFESNRFSVYHIEAPVEFRWRSSTPTQYKFYRIHTGVIFYYAYWNRATFVQDGTRFKLVGVDAFKPFQMEAFLLLGYNTINFYASYGITPFFDSSAQLNEQVINFRPLKLGISFYFL